MDCLHHSSSDLDEDSISGAELANVELPEFLVDENQGNERDRDDPRLIVDSAEAQGSVDHWKRGRER